MAKETEPTAKVGKKTITLTFDGDDEQVYERLVNDAKTDRRTVAQHTLLFIINNYSDINNETE